MWLCHHHLHPREHMYKYFDYVHDVSLSLYLWSFALNLLAFRLFVEGFMNLFLIDFPLVAMFIFIGAANF